MDENGSPGNADKNPLCSKESEDLELKGMTFCVSQKGCHLIVKSFGDNGIAAFDLVTGNKRWEVRGMLAGMQKPMTAHGIDTDGQGHLFVCDTANQCIQMFSFNGEYLGVLLKSRDLCLGTPLRICWCRDTYSAVVLYHKNSHCYIAAFRQQ